MNIYVLYSHESDNRSVPSIPHITSYFIQQDNMVESYCYSGIAIIEGSKLPPGLA